MHLSKEAQARDQAKAEANLQLSDLCQLCGEYETDCYCDEVAQVWL